MIDRPPTTARTLARLAPFLLAGLALSLVAPTCGGYQPGLKTFAKGSLIIPMDVCYQCTLQAGKSGSTATQLNAATSSCTRTGWVSSPSGNPCPQQLAQGDVIKAYGLVYQLIRNDVPVYWVIDPAKTAVDGYDLAVQYNGGFPVSKLDWVTGQASATKPTAASLIRYMGGPFVVDGSDAARAIEVMQDPAHPELLQTFGSVNVHVSSVAFQGYVAKTMAGGWSDQAGQPPKLALLDIGSGQLNTGGTSVSSAKNSEPIIRGYLARAGLNVPGAGGVAAGPHGLIYDRLTAADFIPTTPGDWTTSTFGRIATDPTHPGYQILWVPHWLAPGSCSDYSSNTACYASLLHKLTPPVDVQQILRTIGAFEASGRDVFAECAGLGSFEGHAGTSTGSIQPLPPAGYARDYRDGDPSTRFQTTLGLDINAAITTPRYVGTFSSPFLQVGDFPYVPVDGAIRNYRSASALPGAAWRPETVKLITDSTDQSYAYFTVRPRVGTTGPGSAVYLGGHAYSGYSDTLQNGNLVVDTTSYPFQAAGSRLVLNTLFNLGAGCVDSNVACVVPNTLGECAKGLVQCVSGQPQCVQQVQPKAEDCDGKDNDCNGAVDDIQDLDCYSGLPAATEGVGQCRGGTRSCQYDPATGGYGFSACQGEVIPAAEACNGLDDDCDGRVDNVPGSTAKLSESCYSGPAGTEGVGTCHGGTRTCDASAWSLCLGEVTPRPDVCDSVEGGVARDTNCDNVITACTQCTAGATNPCYTGPPNTLNVGPCRAGTQSCLPSGEWSSECNGQVLPAAEICNDGIDQGCHGDLTGENAAGVGQPNTGHDGPPYCATCQFVEDPANPGKPDKTRTDKVAGCWTGRPDAVFEGTTHPTSVCKRGVQYCQADFLFGPCEEQTLDGPELCNGRNDNCDPGDRLDEGATCGAGFACENGVCVASSCGPETPCRDGYSCNGGACKLSSCCRDPECTSLTVCAAGRVCVSGAGDQACADPCARETIQCGTGATCAGGFCTGGGCYATGCPAGQACQNGECVADRCAGVSCPAGTFCRQGDCVQACAFVACGPSERCDADGFCVADPCAGKSCGPTERCVAGTCQQDLCVGVACGSGQACLGGACVDDPCAGVTCPAGLCRDGQCFATHAAVAIPGTTSDGGGGCGCGNGAGSPLALLGLLLALPLARRRRRGPGAAALPLVALAGLLLGPGCTTEEPTPFDPASCAALAVPLDVCPGEGRCVDLYNDPSHCGTCGRACGAGQWCVDMVCGPASAVAPRLLSVSPAAATVGGLTPTTVTLSGERLAAGASLRATGPLGTVTVPTERLADGRLTAQLDLATATPGTWTLRVVNPDNVISNSKGFGVVIPTPSITRVEPSPDAGPNATPPAVPAGGTATLVLHGSGFMVGSACWATGPRLLSQQVASELQAASGGEVTLACTLDLSAVQPGQGFKVWVVNDDAHRSGEAAFQVKSGSALLDSISPSRMNPGQPTSVKLFGTGFDITSKAWLSGTAIVSGTQPLNTFLDFPTQLTMAAPNLSAGGVCGAAACPVTDASHKYYLEVCNGCDVQHPPTGLSGRKELILETSGRTVTGLTAPNPAYQGTTPTVTLAGSGLSGTSPVIQYRPLGATTWREVPAASTVAGATSVSGPLNLVDAPVGSAPAGSWEVRLHFGSDDTDSASFALRVDSNQAIMMSTPAPAYGQAGTTVTVVLTVSNLQDPLDQVRVLFYDPAQPIPACPSPACLTPTAIAKTGDGNVSVRLALAGRETKPYALAVLNPGTAPPSLSRPFTVVPGVPTVTGLACTSVPPTAGALCENATTARQQAAPVPIRITGTNFALADAGGLNGSQIAISSAAVGVVDQLLPQSAITVTSPTQIDVLLDTTLAALQWVGGQPVATTYTMQVWNQGGAQRSATFPTGFTIKP